MRLPVKIRPTFVILVLGILVFGAVKIYDHFTPPPPLTGTQVVINPTNHTITISGPNGTHTTTLPNGNSTITVNPDGTLNVKAKQFGLELRPFAGIGYSNGKAFILGADILYFKRLDLGLGLTLPQTQPGVCLSYNVWSNLRVTGLVGPMGSVGGFVTVRF